MALLLHIGASKCGSSALQTALTAGPVITRRDGSTIKYTVMNLRQDRLLEGEALTRSVGVSRYRASPNANDILKASLKRIGKSIREYPTDLMLSSEGWLFQPTQWAAILERINVEVDVVVYVRPQVLVLNSAWWQWGAWSDKPFDKWIEARLMASMWGNRISQWKKLRRIRRIIVRPVVGDVVQDFYDAVIAANPPQGIERPNPSLSGPVLRLFQRNRSLRPTIHASGIDFALSNSIPMTDPSIWVLDRNWIKRILEHTRSDNQILMSHMDNESAKAVRNDPKWWNEDAYSDRLAESPLPQPIPSDKLEEMCVEMAKAIYMQAASPKKR